MIMTSGLVGRYGNEDGFDRFDLNGDGIVDADEFRVSELACMQLQQGDTNRDGKFDRAEWIKKYFSTTPAPLQHPSPSCYVSRPESESRAVGECE